MGWKILIFHGKHNDKGIFIPNKCIEKGFVKVYVVHPRFVGNVLRDLHERYVETNITIPLEIRTSVSACLDLSGIVFTDKKMLWVGLSCGRIIEFWSHHAENILFELETRLREPAGKRWCGKPGQRWTELHTQYNCFCLSWGDVRAIVESLQKQTSKF